MPLRGRSRTKSRPHPPCFYESHGAYYHVVKGVWHPLGRNLPAALGEYGRRVQAASSPEHQLDPLMDAVFERLKKRTVDPWSPNTVKQYTLALAKLKHPSATFRTPSR